MSRRDKKKKGGKKKCVVWAILLLAAAGGYFYLKKGQGSIAKENADPFPGMVVEEAFEGAIAVTTEGSGSIEAASKKAVTMEYDGKLESIYIETGDQVQAGDELAVYDRKALDAVIEAKESELTTVNQSIAQSNQYGSYYITSPVPGCIKRIFAVPGDSVEEVIQKYGGLVEISADNKLKVEFTAEGFVPAVGKPVIVTFDYYTETGVVEAAEGDRVTVTIPDNYGYQIDTRAVIYTGSWERIGEGLLKSNQPYLVQADSGVISYSFVSTYSMVYAGSALYSYSGIVYDNSYLDLLKKREELTEEIQELKEYQKNPVMISEYDGYIVSLDAMEGMNYKKDQQLCTIADSSTLNLKVDIDELDIDGVSIGERAEIVFDAFEDQTFEGRVEKVSGVGKNAGGVTTYTVTIALPGNARIKDAMSATASIILDEKQQTVLLPVDAVLAEGDLRYVQVVNGRELVKTEVHTGLVNEEYIEILDGISAGTEVAVKKTASQDAFARMMEASQERRNAENETVEAP